MKEMRDYMKKRILVPVLTAALLINLCSVQAKGINLYYQGVKPLYASEGYQYQVRNDGGS